MSHFKRGRGEKSTSSTGKTSKRRPPSNDVPPTRARRRTRSPAAGLATRANETPPLQPERSPSRKRSRVLRAPQASCAFNGKLRAEIKRVPKPGADEEASSVRYAWIALKTSMFHSRARSTEPSSRKCGAHRDDAFNKKEAAVLKTVAEQRDSSRTTPFFYRRATRYSSIRT